MALERLDRRDPGDERERGERHVALRQRGAQRVAPREHVRNVDLDDGRAVGGRAHALSMWRAVARRVELPLADTAEAGHQPPSTDQPSVRLRRVLIIEDNADSAESLRQYLEFHGHTGSVAHSGAEGLTLAATFGPNVVVCDVGLPGMDGYPVATELRRMTSPPELIIAVSGHGHGKCHAAIPTPYSTTTC